MRKLFPVVVLTALALVLAAPAMADPIGPNCGTCQGSIYTLTYNPVPVSSTGTTQTWQVTLTIDTAGYNAGGLWIDNIAVKVSSSLTSSTLVSAPGGIGAWTLVAGGLNAGGCSGSGSGFICADATPTGAGGPAPVPGATYSWGFNLEIPTGDLNTSPLGASIKARYINNNPPGKNGNANKVGDLVSENIDLQLPPPPPPPPPQVPEPSSLVLLGTGLVSVAGLIRRRLVK